MSSTAFAMFGLLLGEFCKVCGLGVNSELNLKCEAAGACHVLDSLQQLDFSKGIWVVHGWTPNVLLFMELSSKMTVVVTEEHRFGYSS